MSRHIAKALLISALIMAGALGLAYLASHELIPGDQRELSTRGYNVTIALILVWWTNLAPKRLRPLAELRGDPAIEQSARRFASRAVLCGGLLSTLAWLMAPFDLALPLEAAAIGSALVMVCVRPLLARAQRRLS